MRLPTNDAGHTKYPVLFPRRTGSSFKIWLVFKIWLGLPKRGSADDNVRLRGITVRVIPSGSNGGRETDGPLIYIDHSDIRPGKVAELTRAVSALVEFIEEREPQLLSYSFHIDPDTSTMAVVAVHPDRASLQLHLEVGGPEFRKAGEFIELRRIEVYGDPGPLREVLHQKARMLGRDAQVVVRDRTAGFARFLAADASGPSSAR